MRCMCGRSETRSYKPLYLPLKVELLAAECRHVCADHLIGVGRKDRARQRTSVCGTLQTSQIVFHAHPHASYKSMLSYLKYYICTCPPAVMWSNGLAYGGTPSPAGYTPNFATRIYQAACSTKPVLAAKPVECLHHVADGTGIRG